MRIETSTAVFLDDTGAVSIAQLTDLSIRRTLSFITDLELSDRERMIADAVEPIGNTPEEFAAYIKSVPPIQNKIGK